MKYHVVVADPMDMGMGTDNARMCQLGHVEMVAAEMAEKYPGRPIVILKPYSMYQTKVKVDMTKFTINDKMEILPA